MKSKIKRRLIIDASSILRACHYAGKDMEFGYQVDFYNEKREKVEKVWVNPAEWGFDNFVVSYKKLLQELGLQPYQTIFVKDGKDSRAIRRELYPRYKAHRPPIAPELNEEYFRLMDGVADEILAMGGTVVEQDEREADDLIAYLSETLEGKKIIWSRDGDMLALRSENTDVYLKDTMNPEMYKDCPAEYVLLYKALVGDSSDGLPGAKGFGPAKFTAMVLLFGFDGCDSFLELLETNRLDELKEDVAEFKPLQKVLDNQVDVYGSYVCAKFYTNRVNTAREPMDIQTGLVQEWDPDVRHYMLKEYFGTKTLITADNFEKELPNFLGK